MPQPSVGTRPDGQIQPIKHQATVTYNEQSRVQAGDGSPLILPLQGQTPTFTA
ncbi:hypothetical protein [Gloeomargarita sp.]